MSLIGLVVLYLRGIFVGDDVPLVLTLIPAAFLGKVAGTALLKRVSERAFRTISLGIVILTGSLGAATALWALL